MRIILTQNVPNLGSLGDEVHVKDGYARNFLLPRGMALAAGGRNARELEHRRHHLEALRQEAVSQAKGEAERLEAVELVVKARAGAGGRLFGAVTNRDLQALLAEQGFELDRKAIQLGAPAKSLGNYTATVRLHSDVRVEVAFRVESQGEPEAAPAGEEQAAAEAQAAGEEQAAAEAQDAGEVPDETEAPAETSGEPAEEPTA